MKRQVVIGLLATIIWVGTGRDTRAEESTVKSNRQTSKAATAKRKSKATNTLTEAQALELVRNRKEVLEFLGRIKQSKLKGSTAHVELDRKEGGEYIIHVYEYVPDDKDTGHTATFNWYHVDVKSRKVKTEF